MAIVPISSQVTLPEDLTAARGRLLTDLSPALANSFGFTVTADAGTSITWTRRFTPGWAIALAVVGLLVFLLGLLFLLVRRENVLVASLAPRGEGITVVTFSGSGPDRLPELFAALEEGAAKAS